MCHKWKSCGCNEAERVCYTAKSAWLWTDLFLCGNPVQEATFTYSLFHIQIYLTLRNVFFLKKLFLLIPQLKYLMVNLKRCSVSTEGEQGPTVAEQQQFLNVKRMLEQTLLFPVFICVFLRACFAYFGNVLLPLMIIVTFFVSFKGLSRKSSATSPNFYSHEALLH